MRYKGYYFDEETGFYYCKSRYYVPEWCRWLNADSPSYLKPYSATGNNLFTYCENNPVMGYDPNGTFDWNRDAKQVLGVCAIIGLTAFAIIVAATNSIPLSGLAIGTALGLATNVTSQVVGNVKDGEQAFNSLDYKQMLLGAATGLAFATTGASGLIGAISIGAVSNAGMSAFKDNSWGNILGSAVVGGVAAGIGYGVGRLVSRFVFANDDMQYGEYYELTHLDRNAICSTIRAFGASLHTFLPTIVNPLSRAITQVLGNIFIGWF